MKNETYQVRVKSLHWECEGVIRLVLIPLEGQLPEPEAGAHIDLINTGGPTRQYSLTAGSTKQEYILGVRLNEQSRGGSLAVHSLLPGNIISVSSPRNAFPLVENGPVHLIAGGIGITPILYMAQTLSLNNREWSLQYYCRSIEQAPFLKEVIALGGRATFTEIDGHPDLSRDIENYSKDTHLYCCGPSSMLEKFTQVCNDRDPNFVHVEHFSTVPIKKNENSFFVKLQKTGKTLIVPEDLSILDVMIKAGLTPKYNCNSGICGECEATVLEGEVDHKDIILSNEEKASGAILICCSRAKNDLLVLDA